jgi:hypothetical protein
MSSGNGELTTVDWIWSQLPGEYTSTKSGFDMYQMSKEMEKEQHGKTWDNAIQAHEQRGHVKSRSICDFDEYYNETYGGNK